MNVLTYVSTWTDSPAPNYKLFFNNFHFIPPPSLFTCKPIKCSYKYLLSPHTQKLGGHFENSFLTRHLMPTPIYMLLCFVLFPFSTFVLNYVVKYRKRTDFLQTRSWRDKLEVFFKDLNRWGNLNFFLKNQKKHKCLTQTVFKIQSFNFFNIL